MGLRPSDRKKGRPAAAEGEWIGGMLEVPTGRGGEPAETRRPMALWVARGRVMAQRPLESASEATSALADLLREAATRGVLPTMLRVATEDAAVAVRAVVAVKSVVKVGALPEIDRMAMVFDDDAHSNELSGTFSQDGRCAPGLIGAFFESAFAVWTERPWKIVGGDDEPIGVHCPALGLDHAVAAVIGGLDKARGFTLFENLGEFERFHSLAIEGESPTVKGCGPMFSVNFDGPPLVTSSMVADIARNGWKRAAPDATPWMVGRFVNARAMAPSPMDYLRATAVSDALATFFREHGRQWGTLFEPGEGVRFSHVAEDVLGAPEIEFTVPAEGYGNVGAVEDEYLSLLGDYVDDAVASGSDTDTFRRLHVGVDCMLDWLVDRELHCLDEASATNWREFVTDYLPRELRVRRADLEGLPEELSKWLGWITEEECLDNPALLEESAGCGEAFMAALAARTDDDEMVTLDQYYLENFGEDEDEDEDAKA